MNKYTEMLERLRWAIDNGCNLYEIEDICEVVEELVNKETPLLVKETESFYMCARCNQMHSAKYEGMCIPCLAGRKYCPECGQAQDWSEVMSEYYANNK